MGIVDRDEIAESLHDMIDLDDWSGKIDRSLRRHSN